MNFYLASQTFLRFYWCRNYLYEPVCLNYLWFAVIKSSLFLKKVPYRSATITCKAILAEQQLVSIFDSKTISGTIYIEKSCLIQQFVTNGELQSSVIAAVTIFIWVGRVPLFISASWFSSNIYWIMLMLAYGTASWKFCEKGVENF